MILVFTGDPPGDRHEFTDVAEALIDLIVLHADRLNAIEEGSASFLIWPDGAIEFNLTEMVGESSIPERAAAAEERVRLINAGRAVQR